MNEKIIKTWLDIAPAYMDFFLKYLRSPPHAFEGVTGTGKVSSDQTNLLLGGVVVSYLIVLLFGSPRLQSDPGAVAQLFRSLDLQTLPVIAIFVTFIAAILTHGVAKFYSRFISKLPQMAKLGGSVEDSVNAALGFAAVFVPLLTGVVVITARLPVDLTLYVGVPLAFATGVFACVYFSWSLSATHPDTTPFQAFGALCGGGVIVYGLVSLVT
ncbi:MAG: hypothetical protein ACE5G1_16395 [bacterium]